MKSVRSSIPQESLLFDSACDRDAAKTEPPRYVLIKHYLRNPHQLVRFLFLQRVKGYDVSEEPHIDEAAGQLFRSLLQGSSAYLEFGSGGSTQLANQMAKRTLSIESDRFFARSVRKALGDHSTVQIIDIDIGLTGPWSYPIFDWPTRRRLRRWSRYIRRPFALLKSQNWLPDFVFVDGRFRRACVLQTARSALERGCSLNLLFDDYFADGREHYHAVEHWLGAPERVGRAALFTVDQEHCRMPSEQDIVDAVRDYR